MLYKDLEIDFDGKCVRKKGEGLKLTPIEYRVLAFLAKNIGKTIPPGALIQAVWGPGIIDKTLLKAPLCCLREKLEDSVKVPKYVRTHSTLGYIMDTET